MRNDENTFRSDLEEVDYVGLDTPKKGVWGGYPPGGGGGPKHSELPTTPGQNGPPPLTPRGGGGGTHTPKSEINNSVSFLNPKKQ